MKICKLCILVFVFLVASLSGVTYGITIDGSDAIFLAGRTDVTVPPAAESWDFLLRHVGPTPEEIRETHPSCIAVVGGASVYASATGGIHFFNGFGPPFFSPDGNGDSGSVLDAIDGISGYKGPEGPLVGVFLDDSIPDSGPAPAALDFTPSGLTQDFLILSPQLGQVFYIGDGVTSSMDTQYFMAPSGATRLCLGIPDGWGFNGAPGYYDDNDGSYEVELNVYVDLKVDIKPTSCPNPLNVKSKGVIPVAILGTELFDVNNIDPDTIELEGVSPIKVLDTFDVSQPFVGELVDCDSCVCGCDIADGHDDLLLKFDTQEIVEALGDVEDGECKILQLTGETFDGIPIVGEDVMKILKKGK